MLAEQNNPCSCDCNENAHRCHQMPDPFTQEELNIFNRLASIKKEAHGLKLRFKDARLEREEYASQLGRLRKEWKRWRVEAEMASRRRMMLLGHLEP